MFDVLFLKSNDFNCNDSSSVIHIFLFDCADNLDIIFSKRKKQIDLLMATLFCSNRIKESWINPITNLNAST